MTTPTFNNEFGIDYDKPGFCALCHVRIADFNGFNPNGTPIIVRMLGITRQFHVQLDDGSQMTTMMCVKCLDSITPEKMRELMESVQKGWQWEVENLMGHWTDEHKAKYLKRYRKRHVVNRLPKSWNPHERARIRKPRRAHMNLHKV